MCLSRMVLLRIRMQQPPGSLLHKKRQDNTKHILAERERDMKIQCNVCEAAEATVLCCADEAALCWACDEKVHAANKLASKHQRVPLSTSHMPPNCDICQVLSPSVLCCLEIYASYLICTNTGFFLKKKKNLWGFLAN